MPSTTLPPTIQLKNFKPTSSADDVVQALIHDGGCFIRNLLPQATLDEIERDVRPHLEADKPWNGDFFPPETRRVYGLAGKSKTFTESIPGDKLYREVCDKLLSATITAYTGQTLNTSVSKPQLNNTIVFSIGPGARRQELHRDDMIHHNQLTAITADQYEIGRDVAIGFFVAGKQTTTMNGATRFIPGSHLWDHNTPPNEDLAVFAEMNAGDAFMMFSSCYHAGSANMTTDQERLIYSCFAVKGYLRQVIIHALFSFRVLEDSELRSARYMLTKRAGREPVSCKPDREDSRIPSGPSEIHWLPAQPSVPWMGRPGGS